MHPEVFEFVQRMGLAPRVVVECGSHNVNGTVRDLFPGVAWTGVDPNPGPGVDVCTDFQDYWPHIAPDLVVCCEVLEHTRDVAGIVAHAFEILAKGGLFLVTCATTGRAAHSAFDGGPLRDGEFYRNVELFSTDLFTVMHSESENGDLRMLLKKG